MQKFVPKEKLSKKAKKELDGLSRKSWNGISPITRKPEKKKAYKRRKVRKISDDFTGFSFMQ